MYIILQHVRTKYIDYYQNIAIYKHNYILQWESKHVAISGYQLKNKLFEKLGANENGMRNNKFVS